MDISPINENPVGAPLGATKPIFGVSLREKIVTKNDIGKPHITYQSGALENNTPEDQGIRQQVCRILEGGSDAFRKRERRYDLGQE